MRILLPGALCVALSALVFNYSESFAEDSRGNPHSDSGDCSVCHVASADKLRSWFAFASTKREMKDGSDQMCLQCHTIKPVPEDSLWVGIGHATGKKPAVNKSNLPLSAAGTITCATTCHNMHGVSDDRQQQIKHLRLPVNSLCKSCHNV